MNIFSFARVIVDPGRVQSENKRFWGSCFDVIPHPSNTIFLTILINRIMIRQALPKLWLFTAILMWVMCIPGSVMAANIVYVYGDVAADGTVPSGPTEEPFDQMLLTDSGSKGLSEFRDLVVSEGHSINQRYDQSLILDASFLGSVDVIIFGLHQKIWSAAEKSALDSWLRAGGGIFIYSDSASGGLHSIVGAQNQVGQNVVKNLVQAYGIQVTVDQANGVRAVRASTNNQFSLMSDRPILEGEGVSPIAIESGGEVVNWIPYRDDPDNLVSGNPVVNHLQGLSNVDNLEFSALASRTVEQGRIVAMFDRQPMWNTGPGSDINKRDNKEILRRVMNYLAEDTGGEPPVTSPPTPGSSGNSDAANIIPPAFLLLD